MPKDLPKMPDGLEDLLRGLSKAVLKEKPENILDFSAKYFENLLIARDGSLMKNYERFEHYEKSLNKIVKQKKISAGDSAKKIVKSDGKSKKSVVKPNLQNTKPNDKVAQKIEKVPSPIFGDKVIDKQSDRKLVKLKTRARSSIPLNAITEESNAEMKEERRLMYRNAVKKIQRAFRRYMDTKKQKSISQPPHPDANSRPIKIINEDQAARIIQNLFKSKFPKKSPPLQPGQTIRNKNGGEDSKSLIDYSQEEENSRKTAQPNTTAELDSDTGETLTTIVGDEDKISNADSLENMIIKEEQEMNSEEQNSKPPVQAPDVIETPELEQKHDSEMELAAVKIQKNFRGYKVRKDMLTKTKNVVNDGNLVAVAGNIIGSVVPQLNPSENYHQLADVTPLNEAHAVHGTVAEISELLNDEHISDSAVEVVGKSDPEVSQTTTQAIESVIGINEQKHETAESPVTSVPDIFSSEPEHEAELDSTEAGLVESNKFSNNEQIEHSIHIDSAEETPFENNSALDSSLNSEINSDSAVQNHSGDIKAHGEVEPNHGIDLNTIDETVPESNLIENNNIKADTPVEIHTVHPVESVPFEPKHETESVVNNAVPLQSNAISDIPLNSDIISDTPVKNHSADTETLDKDEPEHEIGLVTADVAATQRNLITDLQIDSATDIPRNSDITTVSPVKNNSAGNEVLSTVELKEIEIQDVHAADSVGPTEPKHEIKESIVKDAASLLNNAVPDVPLNRDNISGSPVSRVHSAVTKVFDSDEPQHEIKIDTSLDETISLKDETAALQSDIIAGSPVKNHSADIKALSTVEPTEIENRTIPAVESIGPIEEKHETDDSYVKDALQSNTVSDVPLNGDIISGSPVRVHSSSTNAFDSEEPKHEIKIDKSSDDTMGLKDETDALQSNIGSPVMIQSADIEARSTVESKAIEVNSVEPNHGTEEPITDAAPVIIHSAESKTLDTVEPKHEIGSLTTEVSTQEGNPIITSARTESPTTETDAAQSDAVSDVLVYSDISTNTPIEIQNVDEPSHSADPHLFRAQESLNDLNGPEMTGAALTIQKSFRGHQARKALKQEQAAQVHIIPEVTVDGASEELLSDSETANDNRPIENQNNDNLIRLAEPTIESVMPLSPSDTLSSSDLDHQNAALKIQKTYRGHQVRKELKQKKTNIVNSAATVSSPTHLIETKDLAQIKVESLMDILNDERINHQESIPDLNDPEIIETALKIHEALKEQNIIPNEPNQEKYKMLPIDKVSVPTENPDILFSSTDGKLDNTSEKQDVIITDDVIDPDKIEAAIKIQNSYRGHKVRKDYKQMKEELGQKKALEAISSLLESTNEPANVSVSENIKTPVAPIINNVTEHPDETVVKSTNSLDNNNVAPLLQDDLPDLNDPEMADAALKIQKSFRGHQARKDVRSIRSKRSIDNYKEEEPLEKSPEAENFMQQNYIPESYENKKADGYLNSNETYLKVLSDIKDSENVDAISKQDLNNQVEVPDEQIPIDYTTESPISPTNVAEIQDSINQNETLLSEVISDKLIESENKIQNLEKLSPNIDVAPQLTTDNIEHHNSLPDLNDPDMAGAALKIQKTFRGHQVRRELKQNNDGKITEPTVELTPEVTSNEVNSEIILASDVHVTAPITEEAILENLKVTGIVTKDSLPDLNDPEMANAALKIQKTFRGHQTRREMTQKKNIKSTEIVKSKPETSNDVNTAMILIREEPRISNPNDLLHEIDPNTVKEAEMFKIVNQDSLPDLNDPDMTEAAVKIQNPFRGHQARKESEQGKNNQVGSSRETIEPIYINGDLTSNQEGLSILADPKMVEETSKIANRLDKSEMEHQDSLPDLNDPEMADAALKIQKSFRGHQARKEINERKRNQVKVTKKPINEVIDPMDSVDSNPETKLQVEHQDTLPDLNDPEMSDAALKIQKSFRSHKARKELKETKENVIIDKILSKATAPPVDEIGEKEPSNPSNILNNITPDIITKASETAAALNIQRTYRGYRTRRELKSQNESQIPPAAVTFDDENKLIDSLEPILDQKSEDKIDADSLDNFNVEEKVEAIEEPYQKIMYKSKLSMLIENSKSDTQSSSLDQIEAKPNDDYFDSLENTQTSEMDEASPQTVIEVQQPGSIVDTSFDNSGQNTYDSSIFGLKIEPEHEQQQDDSISRKTTAEVEVPDAKVEIRRGLTDDEIKEIQNVDLSSFEKDSLEAMYYSLRKNELLLDQMHSLSTNVEQISDQTEPPRQFTAKQKLLSMGESDSDDIVFKQMSMDYDESEHSNLYTARSTTDDDADVEVVRDVLYYNDGKQILSDRSRVKREPGDGASVASDNLFDSHSNADDQDVPTQQSEHDFEIFSLDEGIKSLESNVDSYQQDNPLFYANQKIEKFLHQIHGNVKEATEGDADDENDDAFLENPIDSNESYLSENKFNAEDEEEDDVVDELRNVIREPSAKRVLSSAISEADSDYIEQSRAKPIKDDFNISTALDNYLSTDSDSTYNSAATKIQAGARGFLTRRRIQSVNRQSISERRSSIGNAAIDQSLDDMIEETEIRKKFKFADAQSTFREDTITSSGEMEMYGITNIKVEQKKITFPVTDSGNESNTSIDPESQIHLRNKYEQFTNESNSFDALDDDKLSDVVDVIRTSNVQNKLRSPIKNKNFSNITFDEYNRVATRRQTLQRGNAIQNNSTPSDEESRSAHPSAGSSSTPTPSSDEKNEHGDHAKKTSYDSPIRRKSTDSVSLMTKSSNSLPDLQNSTKKRGFIQRQRTMPVQIETEIIRPLPKHMRKRIKSANSSAHSSHHASNLYKKKATY